MGLDTANDRLNKALSEICGIIQDNKRTAEFLRSAVDCERRRANGLMDELRETKAKLRDAEQSKDNVALQGQANAYLAVLDLLRENAPLEDLLINDGHDCGHNNLLRQIAALQRKAKRYDRMRNMLTE